MAAVYQNNMQLRTRHRVWVQGKDPRGEQVFFLDGKSHIIWNIRMVIKEDKIDTGFNGKFVLRTFL